MHLIYNHRTGRAEVSHWIIIDDFGTLHDTLMNRGDFGDHSHSVSSRGWDFYWSGLQDPDFTRLKETAPKHQQGRKPITFTGPFGTRLDGELIIDFAHHPAWDDVAFEPRRAKLQGARVEVLQVCIRIGGRTIDVPEATQAELEQLCWDFLHLEQAEEEARAAKRQKEWACRQAAEASQ